MQQNPSSPTPFSQSLVSFNKALNHFIETTKCFLIVQNGTIHLPFDTCSSFQDCWKQNEPLWHFIIFHPVYCFPEFLSLINGPSFRPTSKKKKKLISSPTAYQTLNKSQSITAAVMVMPISQCDLCTHFILKMTLPSICLNRMSCFF